MPIQRYYEINECAASYFQYMLRSKNKEDVKYVKEANDYLNKERHMTAKEIETYRIGYAPPQNTRLLLYLQKKGFSAEEIRLANLSKSNDKGETFSMFRNRIMIPICNSEGKIIGFGARKLPSSKSKAKYINTEETAVFKKRDNLFSLNIAAKSKKKFFILAEGFFDVITLSCAGFHNSVATLGTALTKEQAALIHSFTDTVLIVYDSDEAGRKATDKAISIFQSIGVRVFVLNVVNAKDPDEYIKKFGAKAFSMLIKQKCMEIQEYQLKRITEKFQNNECNTNEALKEVLCVLLSGKENT